MPSLLKKKSEQPQAPLVPAWHPNFRNFEKLPDTKVIRTRFFINFASAVVASGLLLYFCIQEYKIYTLSRQISYWEGDIATNKKANDTAIAQFKKFGEESRKLAEVETFVRPRIVMTSFLMHLGETLPKEVALDAIDARDTSMNLRGSVYGSPQEASGRITTFIEQLKNDAQFKERFDLVTLNNL
jgi:hypothetical protein